MYLHAGHPWFNTVSDYGFQAQLFGVNVDHPKPGDFFGNSCWPVLSITFLGNAEDEIAT